MRSVIGGVSNLFASRPRLTDGVVSFIDVGSSVSGVSLQLSLSEPLA
jgi:hypothetical protein